MQAMRRGVPDGSHRQRRSEEHTSELQSHSDLHSFLHDALPISHKPVAVAAGLGQMGIHRNVIHPKFGNFILLGTVLVDAEISEYSHPVVYNPCLECKLCVAACPTGAIGREDRKSTRLNSSHTVIYTLSYTTLFRSLTSL